MSAPYDLPEPRRPVLTQEERARRQAKVLHALLWLVIGYAFVHKIAVPLFLKGTRLRASPYAELDFWFFPALALGLALRRRQAWLASFLAGGGILYGGIEILLASRGIYPGWLGFSKILSSAPFAGICIGLLTGPFPERIPKAAWWGVLTVASIKLIAPIRGLW